MSASLDDNSRGNVLYSRVPNTAEDSGDLDPNEVEQQSRNETPDDGSQMEADFSDEAGRLFSGKESDAPGTGRNDDSEQSACAMDDFNSDLHSYDKNDLIPTETVLFITMSYLLGMAFIETPFLMRFAGWFGVGVIVVVALITGYTAKMIVSNMTRFQSRHPYAFVSYVTQLKGDQVLISNAVTVLYLLYIVLTAVNALLEISRSITESMQANAHLKKIVDTSGSRVLPTAIGFLLYPLTLPRSPKRYVWLSAATVAATILAGLLLTTLLGNLEQFNRTFNMPSGIQYEDYAIWISTTVLNLIQCFGLHAVLSPLLMDMREPESASKIVGAGFFIPTIFVIVVSMMSYFAFGTSLLPRLYDVIDRTVANKPSTFTIVTSRGVRGLLVIQLCFVYILNTNALNLFFENEGFSTENRCHCCLIRLFTTVMIVLVAAAAKALSVVLVYTNMFLAVIVCVIVPLASSVDSKHTQPHEYIFKGLVIFFIVICTLGTGYGFLTQTVYQVFGYSHSYEL